SGHLDDLPSLEEHVRQSEAPADQAAIGKEGLHFARMRGGGHVEVLGRSPQKQISNTSPHQVRLMPMSLEAKDDFHRLGIQKRWGDLGLRRRFFYLKGVTHLTWHRRPP